MSDSAGFEWLQSRAFYALLILGLVALGLLLARHPRDRQGKRPRPPGAQAPPRHKPARGRRK